MRFLQQPVEDLHPVVGASTFEAADRGDDEIGHGRGGYRPTPREPSPRSRPVKSTTTRSSSATWSRMASSPASPAVPVALTSMPVRRRPSAWASQHLGLGDHDGRAAAGRHALDGPDPVVGLVVEDAVGRRVGLGLPGPHALGPAPRRRAPRRAARPASTPAPAARSLRSARGAGWGGAPSASPAPGTRPARRHRPGRRRGRRRAPSGRSITSQPIVRPPSRQSPFSGPCTVKGTAPPATASRNRCTHGSPGGSVGHPGHSDQPAPSSRRRATHGRQRPVGTKTCNGPLRGPRPAWPRPTAALPHDAMASGGRRRRAPRRAARRPAGAAGSPAGASPCGCRRRCRSRPSPSTPPSRANPRASESASARANGVVTKPCRRRRRRPRRARGSAWPERRPASRGASAKAAQAYGVDRYERVRVVAGPQRRWRPARGTST